MVAIGRRTLRTEKVAGDVQILAADDDDLLAVEELLGDDTGESTQKVTLAIDDDLKLERNVSSVYLGMILLAQCYEALFSSPCPTQIRLVVPGAPSPASREHFQSRLCRRVFQEGKNRESTHHRLEGRHVFRSSTTGGRC
jgi:hypothetical protein